MSISSLPLSYCTNVHPGRSVAEVLGGLDRYTVPIMRRFNAPLAAGLWLARSVVDELTRTTGDDTVRRFADGLAERHLTCHTLNAFPYGDFHSERVKEQVYLPDWTHPERLTYSVQCAHILAQLLPDGLDGSISTVPLGFTGFEHATDFSDQCAEQIIECAQRFDAIYKETGKLIRLAIEPEPFCVIETTPQAIDFFHTLWRLAERRGTLETVRTHIGLCFDVCHQAVEFEDVASSIGQLDRAGVRINKLHVSCALELLDPESNEAGKDALRRYVEPRYLHQTIGMTPAGPAARAVDLTQELIEAPNELFRSASRWRVHFHVPVDAEHVGPLSTTRPALREALSTVAQLSYAPHLEVETYTWEVLPGTQKPDLVTGLSRELDATRRLLAELKEMDKISP